MPDETRAYWMKNLLAAMSRDGLIRNAGSRRLPQWVLNQLGKCDFIQFIHIYPKKDDLGGHNQLLQ